MEFAEDTGEVPVDVASTEDGEDVEDDAAGGASWRTAVEFERT
jgi:hypothetical protein